MQYCNVEIFSDCIITDYDLHIPERKKKRQLLGEGITDDSVFKYSIDSFAKLLEADEVEYILLRDPAKIVDYHKIAYETLLEIKKDPLHIYPYVTHRDNLVISYNSIPLAYTKDIHGFNNFGYVKSLMNDTQYTEDRKRVIIYTLFLYSWVRIYSGSIDYLDNAYIEYPGTSSISIDYTTINKFETLKMLVCVDKNNGDIFNGVYGIYQSTKGKVTPYDIGYEFNGTSSLYKECKFIVKKKDIDKDLVVSLGKYGLIIGGSANIIIEKMNKS